MAVSLLVIGGVVVSIIIGLITALYIHLTSVRKKYSHIPGPPSTSFIFGALPEMGKLKKSGKCSAEISLDWCKKYGKTFKIEIVNKVFVFTAEPQAVRELMITGNHPKPKVLYSRLSHVFRERFMGQGIVLETDQKVWVWRRAQMMPCFQKSYLRGLETAFNTEVDLLVNRLTQFADGKTIVSMGEEFKHITLDIIGKISFGMQMNSIDNKTENTEFTKAIFTSFHGYSQSRLDPFIMFKVSKWKFIREVRKALRFLRVLSRKCFRDRMEAIQRGDYTPDDMLNHLVKMKLENPELDEEVILDDITTFFVAGQETTANLLSFALISLCQNKATMKRLKAEINEIVGEKSCIESDDMAKMTYLELVIKETLRLYPPAASTTRETRHEMEISGYKIPAGTLVNMSTYVSSRLEEFFPDPLKFYPERFSKENESSIPSYTFYPFTLGSRTCLGKDFAKMEAKIILAKLLQRFDFELDPDQSFEIQEVATLRPKGGVMCTLTLCDN